MKLQTKGFDNNNENEIGGGSALVGGGSARAGKVPE